MHTALKTALFVVVLMGVVIGVTACAKYPVVSGARAAAPAASAPALPNR